jgi:hypothetical protein
MEEQIAKDHWMTFLNDFHKTHHGYEARIEIVGRDFGDQEETAWLPFSGISYDPHHHQIIVTVGGVSSRYPAHLTHMIDKPTKLQVHHATGEETTAILIVSPDQPETLVHLRRQAQLTA